MINLFKLYKYSFENLKTKGRTWKQYVLHLSIAIGMPLSLLFFVTTILAVFGLTTVTIDGKVVSGIEVLGPGLAISFIFVPCLCIFVGSIAYFNEEVYSMKE